MPSISSLVAKLAADYPDINFAQDISTHWHPGTRTIFYIPDVTAAELLHEVGHAISGHSDFDRDVTLLIMEREAWTTAQKIAPKYGVAISNDFVENHVDTYRDWLHARSLCPKCQTTGIQMTPKTYECPACRAGWEVNEARSSELRRRLVS